MMEITQQHISLVQDVRKALREWRKFTIAIDGLDGSGKSTLGRFLAWQLGMPVIETDLLLDLGKDGRTYRMEDFRRLVQARHCLDRPIIVEGVLLLEFLNLAGLNADYLIYVEKKNNEGSITYSEEFKSYATEYMPRKKANFIFSWSEE